MQPVFPGGRRGVSCDVLKPYAYTLSPKKKAGKVLATCKVEGVWWCVDATLCSCVTTRPQFDAFRSDLGLTARLASQPAVGMHCQRYPPVRLRALATT